MKYIYTSKVVNPNGVALWPPSVIESSWYSSLAAYLLEHSISNPVNTNLAINSIIFDDEAGLNNFLSTHTLTDPALVADINLWRSSHNITYSYTVNSLSEDLTGYVDIINP